MNSLILTYLHDVAVRLYTLIIAGVHNIQALLNESVIWLRLGKIYGFFTKEFHESRTVNAIKRNGKIKYEESSFACKCLRIPAAVISAIAKAFSEKICKALSESVIAGYARSYAYGFRSGNVKFFGLIIMFAGISGFLSKLLIAQFSVYHLGAVAAGFLLTFAKKINLADYIDGSVLVKLGKILSDCENIKLSEYERAKAPGMYMAAAAVGLITGIAGNAMLLLYALPVALFAVMLVFANPFYGLIAAVLIAPILPTMALVGICLLTIAAVMYQKALRGEYALKMGRCGLCLMFFVVIGFISTVLSPAVVKSVGVWGMYVIFIGFYYIIRDTVRDEKSLEAVIKTFVISGAIVSLYGVLQYIFKWNTHNAWIDTDMFDGATMRAYSTLANPNVLGEYLLLLLPVTAWYMLNYAKTVFRKSLYCLYFAIGFLCLIFTQSRGCWIGFLASAAVFVTYYKSSLWKLVPFVLILLPFVLPQSIITRFMSVGDLTDSSTSYRVFIWMGTFRMLKHYWLGGIGPGEGAFAHIYPEFSYNGIVAPHSHNLFLQLIVESGIISLFVFGFAMLIFLKDMLNVNALNKKHGVGAMALSSAVIGFLVQSLFDYTFYNYRVMAIFFMVLAIGGTLVSITAPKRKEGNENA